MQQLTKVKEVSGLARGENGAILNVDLDSLRAYKVKKAKEQKINEIVDELDIVRNDINSMKSDISDIKNLLSMVLLDKANRKTE